MLLSLPVSIRGLSSRLALLALFISFSCSSYAQSSVEGWGPFQFGMSPRQVENASNIPLKKADPSYNNPALFYGQISVSDLPYTVWLIFGDVMNVRDDKAHLSEIKLQLDQPEDAPIFHRCDGPRIISQLRQKYGSTDRLSKTLYRNGKYYRVDNAMWIFPNGNQMSVYSGGTDNPQGVSAWNTFNGNMWCSVLISYFNPNVGLSSPPRPQLPEGEFWQSYT
jgi:hypothetical protein